MDPDLVHIEKLQGGSDDALTELMTLHKEAVYRYVYRYVGNASDAADLAEETFVRVYFNASKFKPKAKVKTWIFTIATNLCRDWHRRNKRRVSELTSWGDDEDGDTSLVDSQPDEAPSVRDQAQLSELDRHLQLAVDRLPQKLKEPFLLSVLEEKSHDETGELLGLSSKAVETRIYRARKLLKESLAGFIQS